MKALIVAQKESLDGLRDRRALLSALLFPLLGPFLIFFMLQQISKPVEEDGSLSLPVIGSEHAPLLIQYFETQGITLSKWEKEDPEGCVKRGEEEIILRIAPDFAQHFNASQPATLEIIQDGSRIASRKKYGILKAYLSGYNHYMSSMRLYARGIDPQIMDVVSIRDRDLATPQSKGANFFETIIMLAVMAAFLCNMYIAIDAAAGEREKKSLEPLLLNPITTQTLFLGKWMATILFGGIGVLLNLISTACLMNLVPLEKLGMRLQFGATEVILIFLLFLPLVILAGSMQLWLSSMARSFKEAQTYLSLVLFLPMLPGMIMMYYPMNPQLWMAPIPALGQQILASSVLRGEIVSPSFILISILGALVISGIFFVLGARSLKL
ncbi:MAG: ABC transporter permease subunit [Myxococcota bacterium]|nr:ABC transporter permease subunit [Myxococcota bacterium]